MKANIDKTFELEYPVGQVWSFLSNPEKIVTCVPGAQLTEKLDEENYKGIVAMKFGPVAVKYNGAIKIDKLDEANHEMVLSGKGMDAKGKGSAGMTLNGKLKSLDTNRTEMGYQMEVSVTGKIAQFGSRLIVDVSDQLANQFIDEFKKALATENPPADAQSGDAQGETTTPEPAPNKDNAVNAFALMWAVIRNAFARLFSGGKKTES